MTRIVVIDTETTGLSPTDGHRLIEIAAVEIINGVISRDNYFHSYINPQGRKITPKAYKVHGIRDTEVANAPTFTDIVDELFDFIGDAALTTYNRKFDFGFMQSELDRSDKDVSLMRDYTSSCLMLDVADGGRFIKLDSACRLYNIDISLRKLHGALIDTFLAAELYIKFHRSDFEPLTKVPQKKPHTPPVARPIPRAFKHPVKNRLIQMNYCKNPN